MLCECHGHIFIDGEDYKSALSKHKSGVDRTDVRAHLEELAEAGVGYFRDGGDKLGVSHFARSIATEYNIEYVSPVFAIHKRGYYGSIVGREFDTLSDFRALVEELKKLKADFIKIMVSGIITFNSVGELSCPSLEDNLIKDIVNICHGEGFAVMAHCNGDSAALSCIEAGVDSLEHGAFMTENTIDALSSSGTVWVPTMAAIRAFDSREGYASEASCETVLRHISAVKLGAMKGCKIACGSDSGAFGVPHGSGARRERGFLTSVGIMPADDIIRQRFRRV